MPDYGEQFDPTGVQFAWNSHSIAASEKCLRYYQYSILNKYRSRNTHFDFGGWYAASLQHFYLEMANGAGREDAIRSSILLALFNSWEHDRDAAGERIPGTGKPWDSQHNTKDRGTLIRTLVWYFEEFRLDLPVLTFGGKPAVELPVNLDLDDGLVLQGTLDRVVDYSGTAMIMDQKTTGTTITPKFFDQYDLSTQMSCYTYLGNAVFSDPVKGVVIDAVQVAVGFSRFERGVTYRTASQLEEWLEDAMYHIEAARAATKANFFPRNTNSCDKYGGCTFRQICKRAPEVRKNFLSAAFEVKADG